MKISREERQIRYPDVAATKAVAREKRHGRLKLPTFYKCHACDRQAMDYHHANYRPGNQLAVVPLCRSCHRKVHGRGLGIAFGVVPTSVGLIRIAIAGA